MIKKYISGLVEKQKTVRVRKTRSDKKESVRVWVNEFQYRKILKNSKLNKMTITAYCSALVSNELEDYYERRFEEFPYRVEDHIVHIKLNQMDYEAICELSAVFGYPYKRKTVHRVLMNALRTEGV